MSARADYAAALKVERENLSRRPDSPAVARRVAEVDIELGRYEAEPDVAVVETAVPGPISSGRARAAKSAK
jgi:hypothetical protein